MRGAGRVGRCQGLLCQGLCQGSQDVKLWQARTVAPQPHACHSRMHGDLSGPGSPLERVERRPTLRARPTSRAA